MKKLLVLLIAFIPFTFVNAENKPSVKTLEATVEASKISYSGTMENGSYAVMCKLFDNDSNEIDKLSSAVDEHKFSGEFTVTSAGDYKLFCANYEGGATKDVTVTVTVDTIVYEVTPTYNAKTYDAIVISFMIIAVCGVGTLFSSHYLIKRNKKDI
jgi:hypothetical protein